jgi:anti-anti-sigma factor
VQISLIEENGDNVIIGMSGQYWETSDLIKFENYVQNSIENGRKCVKIDLSRVSFISSQALGLLVSAYRDIKKVDGRLVLLKPQGTVKEMIEIAGLDEIMEVEELEQ